MKDVPDIRFKEFSADNWENKKLSELVEIISGGTPSTNNQRYWDGNIDWYTPAEINEEIYISNSIRKITEAGLENSSAKILPAYKTILFTSRATIGKSAILSKSGATNQGFQSLVVHNDADPYFIYSMTNIIRDKAIKIASGSTFIEISGKKLGNLSFEFPLKKEQEKIGIFISKIDNLILLLLKKIDLLKKYKELMLSKIFPKEGCDEPEVRFRGFNVKWQVKKIGDIAISYSGGTPQININKYYNGNIPFIRSGEIYNTDTELYITKEGLDNSSAKMISKGTILYALYGATSGEVNLALLDGAINQAILAIVPNKNIDKNFLVEWLRKEKGNIVNKYLQGGQGNLSAQIVKNLQIIMPQFDEQQKIGKFFLEINNLIYKHRKKMQFLQIIKHSLLSKMFI